jgi:thioredoxin-related protein
MRHAMLTRRHTLALPLAALVAPSVLADIRRPKLGEDGLYHLDWFLESFLDIPEDIAAASAAGKRLVVMWSLKGCPACKRMAENHLVDPQTVAYIRAHFEVLHLNILGSREVTGLGGRKHPEKAFADAEGVRSTPMLQFMPLKPDGREVARLDRLPDVPTFQAFFRYVREEGFARGPFEAWLKRQA